MKDTVAANLQKAGFLVTMVAFGYIVVIIFVRGLSMNPATWVMWTLLDLLIVYSMRKSKNTATAKIMTAFAIGAGVVALITVGQLIVGKTSWQWTRTETLVAVAFGLLLYLRAVDTSDETFQANTGTTAMLVAGIPSLVDAWKNPSNTNSYFWGMCALGCFLTLCGSGKGFTARYMPVGGLVFNGAIALIGGWH